MFKISRRAVMLILIIMLSCVVNTVKVKAQSNSADVFSVDYTDFAYQYQVTEILTQPINSTLFWNVTMVFNNMEVPSEFNNETVQCYVILRNRVFDPLMKGLYFARNYTNPAPSLYNYTEVTYDYDTSQYFIDKLNQNNYYTNNNTLSVVHYANGTLNVYFGSAKVISETIDFVNNYNLLHTDLFTDLVIVMSKLNYTSGLTEDLLKGSVDVYVNNDYNPLSVTISPTSPPTITVPYGGHQDFSAVASGGHGYYNYTWDFNGDTSGPPFGPLNDSSVFGFGNCSPGSYTLACYVYDDLGYFEKSNTVDIIVSPSPTSTPDGGGGGTLPTPSPTPTLNPTYTPGPTATPAPNPAEPVTAESIMKLFPWLIVFLVIVAVAAVGYKKRRRNAGKAAFASAALTAYGAVGVYLFSSAAAILHASPTQLALYLYNPLLLFSVHPAAAFGYPTAFVATGVLGFWLLKKRLRKRR